MLFGTSSKKVGEKLTQVFIGVALCVVQVTSGDVLTGTVYNVVLRQNVHEGRNSHTVIPVYKIHPQDSQK